MWVFLGGEEGRQEVEWERADFNYSNEPNPNPIPCPLSLTFLGLATAKGLVQVQGNSLGKRKLKEWKLSRRPLQLPPPQVEYSTWINWHNCTFFLGSDIFILCVVFEERLWQRRDIYLLWTKGWLHQHFARNILEVKAQYRSSISISTSVVMLKLKSIVSFLWFVITSS